MRGGSPDLDDDKFIACGLAARANYLVTGNKRDFREDQITPTKLVSAGELLNIITLDLKNGSDSPTSLPLFKASCLRRYGRPLRIMRSASRR